MVLTGNLWWRMSGLSARHVCDALSSTCISLYNRCHLGPARWDMAAWCRYWLTLFYHAACVLFSTMLFHFPYGIMRSLY